MNGQAEPYARLTSGQTWSGYLTGDNYQLVAGRIRALLTGRTYTAVHANSRVADYFPLVRTGQRMTEVTTWRAEGDGPGSLDTVSVQDSYGLWSLSTRVPDQDTARARALGPGSHENTMLRFAKGPFDEGRMEVRLSCGPATRVYLLLAVTLGETGEP